MPAPRKVQQRRDRERVSPRALPPRLLCACAPRLAHGARADSRARGCKQARRVRGRRCVLDDRGGPWLAHALLLQSRKTAGGPAGRPFLDPSAASSLDLRRTRPPRRAHFNAAPRSRTRGPLAAAAWVVRCRAGSHPPCPQLFNFHFHTQRLLWTDRHFACCSARTDFPHRIRRPRRPLRHSPSNRARGGRRPIRPPRPPVRPGVLIPPAPRGGGPRAKIHTARPPPAGREEATTMHRRAANFRAANRRRAADLYSGRFRRRAQRAERAACCGVVSIRKPRGVPPASVGMGPAPLGCVVWGPNAALTFPFGLLRSVRLSRTARRDGAALHASVVRLRCIGGSSLRSCGCLPPRP
jgi:hypothetical protein